MHSIKDFFEVITTLVFILIFIIPLLRKRKKNEEKQLEVHAQQASQEKSVRNNQTMETFFEDLFTEETPTAVIEKTSAQKKITKKVESSVVMEKSKSESSHPEIIKTVKVYPFFNSKQLRQAIIMKEILDKPKGLE